jgi:hypothetical protein
MILEVVAGSLMVLLRLAADLAEAEVDRTSPVAAAVGIAAAADELAGTDRGKEAVVDATAADRLDIDQAHHFRVVKNQLQAAVEDVKYQEVSHLVLSRSQ